MNSLRTFQNPAKETMYSEKRSRGCFLIRNMFENISAFDFRVAIFMPKSKKLNSNMEF